MPKRPLNVLCLSFWTPPAVRPQAILLGKMLPEWVKQGVSPVLVSINQKEKWDIAIPQYYIPGASRYLAYIPFLRDFNDRLYLWLWTMKVARIIKRHHIDVIFSFANPQESNLLGAALHKKTGVPFISHFSDPWYDNHYKDFTPERGKLVLELERTIVEASARVIFTNQPAANLVMKKYPSEWKAKAHVIPHCFDVADYPERKTPLSKQRPYRLSYIGAFYQLRTPEIFFKALAQLLKKRPDLAGTFEIELLGAANPYAGYSVTQLEELLVTYGLKDVSRIIPPVSYKESLRHMVESDLLLVIDADIEGSPYLPSKVIDYIGSGTPAVGITPSGSPSEGVLRGAGYWAFAYSELDKLVEFFEGWLSGKIAAERNQDFIDRFKVSSTTKQLIAHFEAVR